MKEIADFAPKGVAIPCDVVLQALVVSVLYLMWLMWSFYLRNLLCLLWLCILEFALCDGERKSESFGAFDRLN